MTLSFSVTTEAQEVTADDILYILLGYGLVLGIVHQFRKGLVHRRVGMTADEEVDSIKGIVEPMVNDLNLFLNKQ